MEPDKTQPATRQIRRNGFDPLRILIILKMAGETPIGPDRSEADTPDTASLCPASTISVKISQKRPYVACESKSPDGVVCSPINSGNLSLRAPALQARSPLPNTPLGPPCFHFFQSFGESAFRSRLTPISSIPGVLVQFCYSQVG